MKKYISLLLAAIMALSMVGCTGVQDVPTTEATQHQTTAAPETTEPTKAIVDTQEKLQNALETSPEVALDASLELTETVVLHAGEFNGNGNTLTGPAHVEGMVSTENAVAMESGKLSNIIIKGGYRCLGDSKEATQKGDIYLDNVTVDGPSYALNFGHGGFTKKLIADECKLYGWSSYTGFESATFTDCTFGWDSTGANGNLRPYVDTYLTGCHFEGKTEADGTVTPFNIKLRDTISGITIMLEDCYVGDTLITEENLYDLLSVDMCGNVIYISNTIED